MLTRRGRNRATAEARQRTEAAKPAAPRVEDYLHVDPMEVELGVGLIRLADPKRGGDLLPRLQQIRQNVAAEIGIVLPKVRIRDNVQLDQHQYRIRIADVPVAEGTLRPVPESVTTIANHLTATIRRHADEILTRDATKHLLDELRKTAPAVVDELIPNLLRLAEVQQVLQLLLHEQVSIRPLGVILETLGDYAPRTKDAHVLAELVRARLGRFLSARYRDTQGRLAVLTLDPALEDRIRAGVEQTEQGIFVRLSPQTVAAICRQIENELEQFARQERPPVVLVSPPIRAAVKQITESHLPDLVVLSYNEITRDTRIESLALVTDMG
jgi:flagellar biosynthesis protein FlhA